MGDFFNSLISGPFVCCSWIIVGIIAGALARQLMGARNQNVFSDFILGILGAIVGNIVAGIFGFDPNTGGIGALIFSLIIATGGAALLIALRRMVTGRR